MFDTPTVKIYKGDFASAFGLPKTHTSILFSFQHDRAPDFRRDWFFLLSQAFDAKRPNMRVRVGKPGDEMCERLSRIGLDDGVDYFAQPDKAMDYFASVPIEYIVHWASMIRRFEMDESENAASSRQYEREICDQWSKWMYGAAELLKCIAQTRIDQLCDEGPVEPAGHFTRHPFDFNGSLGPGLRQYQATFRPAGEKALVVLGVFERETRLPIGQEWQLHSIGKGMALVHFNGLVPEYCIDASCGNVALGHPVREADAGQGSSGEVVAISAKASVAASMRLVDFAFYTVWMRETIEGHEYYLVTNDDGKEIWVFEDKVASVATR